MRNPHEAVGEACDIRDSGVRVLPLVLPRDARFDVVPGRVTRAITPSSWNPTAPRRSDVGRLARDASGRLRRPARREWVPVPAGRLSWRIVVWMKSRYAWPLVGAVLVSVAFAVAIWIFAS